MKTLTISLLALFISMTIIMTATAFAEEEKSEATATSDTQTDHAHREKMDTHMKMMKIKMQAIHEETDPEKRKVLMQAHRQSMHEGMEGKTGEMIKKDHTKGKMDDHARMQHIE